MFIPLDITEWRGNKQNEIPDEHKFVSGKHIYLVGGVRTRQSFCGYPSEGVPGIWGSGQQRWG